jgi:hypothetical protein
VDVLFGGALQTLRPDALGHDVETVDENVTLLGGQDAGSLERTGPCEAGGDVFAPETTVDVQAEVEGRHLGGHLALESSAP